MHLDEPDSATERKKVLKFENLGTNFKDQWCLILKLG